MHHFTIRDIENLSGIKAHTIRIWEQRYNLMKPKRKNSSHRWYSNEDLKQILRISYLYHNGIKISKIARLQSDAYEGLMETFVSKDVNAHMVNQLLEASLEFNEDKFETVLSVALDVENVEDGMLKVIYPYQFKIGMLWITEHIIPAQEHFSSNIIYHKLLLAIDGLPPVKAPGAPVVVLFMPQYEYHEIALMYIHYLLKKYGKKVVYFGANVALDSIEHYCANRHATHLHFHLITNVLKKSLDGYVTELANTFPKHQLIMSGPCVTQVNVQPANIKFLRSMNELIDFTKS